MPDRYDLARQYNTQRNLTAQLYGQYGHGDAHSTALGKLADIAAELHAAESAAGVARGSTREEIHKAALAALDTAAEGCTTCQE